MLACFQSSTLSSQFADLGVIGASNTAGYMYVYIYHCQYYGRNTVYRMCGYFWVVDNVAKKSMQEAVDEAHTLPEYAAKGEVSNLMLHYLTYITKL